MKKHPTILNGYNPSRYFLALSLFLILALPVGAQYNIHQWSSFEQGAMPGDAVPIGNFSESVAVVDFSALQGMPPEFRSPKAARETGRFGLMMKADPNIWLNGMATGVILDRRLLGPDGRALFQADFFMPPPGEPLPNVAVLAMVPLQPGETRPSTFYRFGMTKNGTFYFSLYTLGAKAPELYKQDAQFQNQLRRPGWHRFQIVFQGPETIHCYVDGREMNFSPIQNSALQNLQVGLMLTELEHSYTAFADNLSIQWTTEDVPLPDSPYVEVNLPTYAPAPTQQPQYAWGQTPAPAPAATPRPVATPVGDPGSPWPRPGTSTQATPAATAAPAPAPGTPLEWLEPEEGWARASNQNKEMLVYLQAPRIESTLKLNQIFETNPNARAFLDKYVLIKIDVNQLQGGMYAQHFNVSRVPTLIVLDPKGNELRRATFTRRDDWKDIAPDLGA